MGMALAAVADNGDLLGLDDVEIGIPIIENAHGNLPVLRVARRADLKFSSLLSEAGGRGHPLPNPPHRGEGVRLSWSLGRCLSQFTNRHPPPCGEGWGGEATGSGQPFVT